MVKNLGGRIELEIGKKVRFLDIHGCVSPDIYEFDTPHTDYRARASLKNGDCVVQTHYDRILPLESGGKAIAVLGEKDITITCPSCRKVVTAESGQTHFTCCSTLEVFFMSDAVNEVQKQEEQKFDLESLKANYEVWTKDGQFSENIGLTTVQLVLLQGETPRKMSFNLYDGKLSTSGKQVDLRLEEFNKGEVNEGKKKFWYDVDSTKYQKALTSKGYEKLA
jgi:hypothetical protein